MKISIIDYGMGNVRSVANALNLIEIECALTNDKREIEDATALILPGVGAFRDGIGNLHNHGLYEVLREQVLRQGKPILGICLGMQLLADGSDEFGKHEGLGLIEGWVKKMMPPEKKYKIPHIGWNTVQIRDSKILFDSIPDNPDYYFVHSYHFDVDRDEYVLAQCTHGMDFTAAVAKDNIMGVQFHPEKSQHNGIKLLKNFCEFAASC